MTTSIRSGTSDGALQLNGVDQITMQTTQVLLAKPISAPGGVFTAPITAPAGATGQLVTFDQVGGLGQIWRDMASSRAIRTTYTNTTGKPIHVSVIYNVNSGGYGGIIAYVNALPLFYTVNSYPAAGYIVSANFIVGAGDTYYLGMDGNIAYNINAWREFR